MRILQACFAYGLEQRPDAGRVHFNGEIVVIRMGGGNMGGRFAHAETDL